MSKKTKQLLLLLPEDHYLFTLPKGSRSPVARELLECGILVKKELEEIKSAINEIKSLLTQEGTNNPPKIKLSELNKRKKR